MDAEPNRSRRRLRRALKITAVTAGVCVVAPLAVLGAWTVVVAYAPEETVSR